ncbi:30S ribosomal protein S16 [Actinobacteria bacterium YIM 96077]|uniref:Small ribosomal subunit protein bS16 n=1 Tax=Phytoactinopolyspora halophila TaxID=1981511 RepID=A0A329QVN4_9ACTN|nr:30S ribosomal protein S16 [Phytoactinopolyspora halophila]AYY12726.1 30S ribosomal protein S16 [Actinobacteria bacterium YIM 96077]RAW16480.1 30S ribosomal protein S16 [Phytoactinopolyspora halophila]
MAVKIKLKRMGKIRSPHYRIIVADARNRRDGRAIEEIGLYNPMTKPSFIKVNSERAQYWLGVGAQPTEPVRSILKVTGDWQKFKGLPGAEGTLQEPPTKADKRSVYDAALAEVYNEPKDEATTAKKKSTKKSSAKKDDAKSKAKDDAKSEDEGKSEEESPAASASESESEAAEQPGDAASEAKPEATQAAAGDSADEA